jgi:hypothetical protein
MAQQDRRLVYIAKAMWPATTRHYEVKAMFGTGTYGGIFFGADVPALVIESDSGEVLDVYPHRKSRREVTIREVLTKSEVLGKRHCHPLFRRPGERWLTMSPSPDTRLAHWSTSPRFEQLREKVSARNGRRRSATLHTAASGLRMAATTASLRAFPNAPSLS